MAATLGVDFLIFVNTGTESNPIWTKVGGQIGGKLTLSGDTVEVTTKDSELWKEYLPGAREWSLEGDGVLLEDDTALQKLEAAYMNNPPEVVMVQFQTAGGHIYQGRAVITELAYDAPADDKAAVSISLQGTGPIEKT